jgi:hypothetical protein
MHTNHDERLSASELHNTKEKLKIMCQSQSTVLLLLHLSNKLQAIPFYHYQGSKLTTIFTMLTM